VDARCTASRFGHRDEGGAVVGTAPVAGQDYAFA